MTGPIPSIVSRSASVAVPRLIGPSSDAVAVALRRRAGRCLRRYDHLLAVGEHRREVDGVLIRLVARAARPLQRVGDAGAGGEAVDARFLDFARDVDDEAA